MTRNRDFPRPAETDPYDLLSEALSFVHFFPPLLFTEKQTSPVVGGVLEYKATPQRYDVNEDEEKAIKKK